MAVLDAGCELLAKVSLFKEIRKQPRYVRETMFVLCSVISISLIGLIWFRSFEKNVFVLVNTDPVAQEKFFADRAQDTPLLYAKVAEALGSLRATFYNALGFNEDYNADQNQAEEEYTGEVHELPLSEDK